MAIKIYRNENYIYVETVGSSIIPASGHAKNVVITHIATSPTDRFSFSGLANMPSNNYNLSDIQDESGSTFANAQAFIDWYAANTGNFNSASGGSGAGDSSDDFGNTLFIFDGSTSVFNIPHSLGVDPEFISLEFSDPTNTDFVSGIRSTSSTNITITCDNAILTGSCRVWWRAQVRN